MDEFGSRIQHSDDPSVKMVPFIYQPTMTAYSIFWPIKDLKQNDEITRDYTPYVPVSEEAQRQAHLHPWFPVDFTEYGDELEEPGTDYFTISRYEDVDMSTIEAPPLPKDRSIKVWTSDHVLKQYLTSKRFELTENREEADIVWQTSHIKDFKELAERKAYVNQFPYEALLTTKDLLAIVSRRAAPNEKSYPRWQPPTFNLNTELPEFLCHYQKRQNGDEDNYWIAKPWNMSRGLGMHITNNLDQLIRLPECGPYIASKYLQEPVLYNRPDIGQVKFDYRYMVFLKSVQPLRLSCYKKFFIRFANQAFSMDSFDEREKHFTVHNYASPEKLLNINCEDFIPCWDQQYPNFPWNSVETETMQCVRELFEAAVSKDPPFGIGKSALSRAHYAMDFMIKWDTDASGKKVMVPQILECNFTPDNARGCQNYPEFYNDILKSLYLDNEESRMNEIVIS